MLLRNLAIASTLAIAAPAVAYAAEAPAAVEVVKTDAAAPKAAADSHNYAQREAQDQKTADFQGGDLLIVGISGGAIIVLLFLLLILA
jgi:uncharacterized low-complexity protein